MGMSSGDLLEVTPHLHRACASTFPCKCFPLMNGTGKRNRTRPRETKTFQLLNLSFKISFEIGLRYKKLFMSVLDTAAFGNLRGLI